MSVRFVGFSTFGGIKRTDSCRSFGKVVCCGMIKPGKF
jgi:hypothetical protein